MLVNYWWHAAGATFAAVYDFDCLFYAILNLRALPPATRAAGRRTVVRVCARLRESRTSQVYCDSQDSVASPAGTGNDLMYVTKTQTPSLPNAPPNAGIPLARP